MEGNFSFACLFPMVLALTCMNDAASLLFPLLSLATGGVYASTFVRRGGLSGGSAGDVTDAE